MYKIDMDTVVEQGETIEGVMAEMIDGLDVTAEIESTNGPSGWPIVTYKAVDENMIKRVINRYVTDLDTFSDLVDMIETA